MPELFDGTPLIWIAGNDFCCMCAWWHNQPIDYGHLPMLCLTCMDDYYKDQERNDRDSNVTPARKSRWRRAS